MIQALLQLEAQSPPATHRAFRLYFRQPPPEDAFPNASLRVIPFPRLWTHGRLSWEMVRHPPDLLFVPAHVLPLIHPRISLVTIHDLGYHYFPDAHPPLQRLYLDLSTRWNAHTATHILTLSQATKADLISHHGTPAEKISVTYVGYDETLAPVHDRAVIQQVKARYAIPGDYLLYLGTLQPRKNLARIIEAFAALQSKAVLVLAGKRGWLYDDLFQQVRRLGLENRILFPGYVAQADKAALLSGAQAFIFPSLYEGFGMPVLEAQACGCPVITSTTSGLPEAAGDGALLVNPQHTSALASAMRRTLSDSRLRQSLVERGFDNARRFSWTRCAQVTRSAIDACLGA